MNEKIDMAYAESLIKDFPHYHGFYGYNVTKKVRDFIKLKYNMEISTNNYNYILFNGIDRIRVYNDYNYRICDYRNDMIIIYYHKQGPKQGIRTINDEGTIDAISRNLIYNINYNISKILIYECIDNRLQIMIPMCHILSKISGYIAKDPIPILKGLSPDRVYTREEITKLGVSEMSININKQNIPIVEEISKNKYVFYSNNFKKYINIIKEEYAS